MEITKIEIETKNKKHRTDIAMLVDKISFLKDIKVIRKKWQINRLYKPSEINVFLDWLIAGDKNRNSDYKKAKKRLKKFNQDIIIIRNKYNRTKNFDVVIKYAIACNLIPNNVYRSCFFDKILLSSDENSNKAKNYQYVIILSPRTEKNEVKEVFDEFQEHIRSKIKFHKHDWPYISGLENHIEEHVFGAVYPSADITKFKTLKELNRTREWYWMKIGEKINGKSKEEKTYSEIVDLWREKCPYSGKEKLRQAPNDHSCEYCEFDSQNRIEKAVSNYIKLLNKS